MSVAFYISGHGFGHSVRQIAIINALHALKPDLPIVVRTSAPEWLFRRTACGASVFIPGETDTGVVQIDGLRLDVKESIRRARTFLDRLGERVAAERRHLEQHQVQLVVSDAPPLACAASAAAGIPSVVCSNFTWDWIYSGYAEQPGADAVVAQIGSEYARALAGWRLPMWGGFGTISPLIDLPFVARHGRDDLDPMTLRQALGLPADRPLALVSFGGYGVEQLPLWRLDCLTEWDVVLTSRGAPHTPVPDRVHILTEERLYRTGFRYEDLVRLADVVVTKPGYGIIADCVANDTAMLYTSRGRFVEYDVLVREMPRYLRCQYLSREAFEDGAWNASLRRLASLLTPAERARTDGAEVASAMIAELVSGL